MSERYVVVFSEDRTETDRLGFGDFCWHLVDSTTDTVVWSDSMEPEDAILPRDLKDLVAMLNNAESRAEVLCEALTALHNIEHPDCDGEHPDCDGEHPDCDGEDCPARLALETTK